MPIAVRGRDATIYVNSLDASQYLNEYEIEAEADDIEVAPFGADKYFLAGPREIDVTLTGFWNGDAGGLDEVLDDAFAANTDIACTICPGGVFTSKACYLVPGIMVSYDISAESDDVSEAEAELRSQYLRGVILKDPLPVTTSGNGTANISTVATTKGAVAQLHVLSITGSPTSVAISVEGSPDGTTFTPLLTFASITTATKAFEKVETTNTTTIPLQVRAKHTITGGTTPSVSYVVSFARRR